MSNHDLLPDITSLDLDALLALRATVDARLQEKRKDLLAEADRVVELIGTGRRRIRMPGHKDTGHIE